MLRKLENVVGVKGLTVYPQLRHLTLCMLDREIINEFYPSRQLIDLAKFCLSTKTRLISSFITDIFGPLSSSGTWLKEKIVHRYSHSILK